MVPGWVVAFVLSGAMTTAAFVPFAVIDDTSAASGALGALIFLAAAVYAIVLYVVTWRPISKLGDALRTKSAVATGRVGVKEVLRLRSAFAVVASRSEALRLRVTLADAAVSRSVWVGAGNSGSSANPIDQALPRGRAMNDTFDDDVASDESDAEGVRVVAGGGGDAQHATPPKALQPIAMGSPLIAPNAHHAARGNSSAQPETPASSVSARDGDSIFDASAEAVAVRGDSPGRASHHQHQHQPHVTTSHSQARVVETCPPSARPSKSRGHERTLSTPRDRDHDGYLLSTPVAAADSVPQSGVPSPRAGHPRSPQPNQPFTSASATSRTYDSTTATGTGAADATGNGPLQNSVSPSVLSVTQGPPSSTGVRSTAGSLQSSAHQPKLRYSEALHNKRRQREREQRGAVTSPNDDDNDGVAAGSASVTPALPNDSMQAAFGSTAASPRADGAATGTGVLAAARSAVAAAEARDAGLQPDEANGGANGSYGGHEGSGSFGSDEKMFFSCAPTPMERA